MLLKHAKRGIQELVFRGEAITSSEWRESAHVGPFCSLLPVNLGWFSEAFWTKMGADLEVSIWKHYKLQRPNRYSSCVWASLHFAGAHTFCTSWGPMFFLSSTARFVLFGLSLVLSAAMALPGMLPDPREIAEWPGAVTWTKTHMLRAGLARL